MLNSAFKVLLWKMYVVRKRQFVQTIVEFLTPMSLIVSLYCLKDLMMESALHNPYIMVLRTNTSNSAFALSKMRTSRAYVSYLNILSVALGYASFLGPLLPFIFLMIRLLEERLGGITELIKMTGVDPCLLVLAHYLNAQPTAILFSVATMVLVRITDNPMLPNSDSTLVFLGFFMHYQTIFAMAFISSFMGQSATYEVSLSLFVYIGMWVPTRLLGQEGYTTSSQVFKGFLPHAPHYWFLSELRAAEASGAGLTWGKINSRHFTYADGTQNGSVLMSLLMQLVQTFVFLLLAWYVERVLPGKFGIAQPWNFFVKKEYWQRRKSVALRNSASSISMIPDNNRYFENPPQHLEPGIRMMRVYKSFGSGSKKHQALHNVNLDVYKGEITVLLGHNGAGKTTLINIITGMINPSSGIIFVNGFDTVKQQQEIRQLIGYCPQHNLTFPDLTVEEHFMFFSMIKGGTLKSAKATAIVLLRQCDLMSKSRKKPHELSGGVLRRLQLGCALCGNAQILILDEPTSGLDVEARRELWDMLLALRSERTVLLTTHFMEEADVLGDRIAALHQGRVRCHASPMYLKRAVGSGFRLTMTTKSTPDEDKVMKQLSGVAPGISLREKSGRAMVFDLPIDSDLPKLFHMVEGNKKEMDIETLGVGVTTLEEVFLELCCDVEKDKKVESAEEIAYTYVTGVKQILRQTKALFKRQLDYTHSKIIAFLLLQVIMPFVLCCSLTKLFNTADMTGKRRKRDLHLLDPQLSRRLAGDGDEASRVKPLMTYNGYFIPKSKTNATMFAIFNIFVLMSTAMNDVILPCRERRTLARHTHVMASCPPALYWLVTFLYHMALYILFGCNAVFVAAYFFDSDNTVNDKYSLTSMYGALVICGMDFYAFMYFVSFFFSERGACLLLIALSVCLGFLSPILSMALDDLTGYEDEPLHNVIMDYIGVLVPSYVITQTITRVTETSRYNAFCRRNYHKCPNLFAFESPFNVRKCCSEGSPDAGPFNSFDLTKQAGGISIIFVMIQFVFYSIMILLLEYGFINRLWTIIGKLFESKKMPPKSFLLPAVQAEADYVDRVMLLPAKECSDALQLEKVSKIYTKMGQKPVFALNEISLAVRKGECFGLLGPNGSGKTTTFKCISQEESLSSGLVRINGYTFQKNRTQYLRSMGYCPQFFGLDEFRSCRANVRMLLLMRGLSDYDVKRTAEAWIDVVGLTRHCHRCVSGYSGGMVRRVAAAGALCGGAGVTLLDEPTAGVDTAARRLLWAAIKRGLMNNRAIVISSHCMDEIEMLCNRVTILVEGNMVVLGSPAELKEQFATGHALVLKLVANVVQGENGPQRRILLKENMKNTFLCTLKDEHVTSLHYRIRERLSYSEIFKKMSEFVAANSDIIEDFMVSETTLEDVFLTVTSDKFKGNSGLPGKSGSRVRITLPDVHKDSS